MACEFSTNGTTWTSAGSAVSRYNGSTGWAQASVDLTAYKGQTIYLGFLGVMSAKNTAVNILILTTYVSFLLYRRSGRIATVSWAKTGNLVQFLIFAGTASIVIFFGIYGYFVEAAVRIKFSVPQVLSVLFAMIAVTTIDVFMMRGARQTEVRCALHALGGKQLDPWIAPALAGHDITGRPV